MKSLLSDSIYYYICGDAKGGWSSVNYFRTDPTAWPSPSNPLRIASVGDHGVTNDSIGVVTGLLLNENKYGPFSFLIHAGDLRQVLLLQTQSNLEFLESIQVMLMQFNHGGITG